MVENGWKVDDVTNESAFSNLFRRLDYCRKILIEWSSKAFPNNLKID